MRVDFDRLAEGVVVAGVLNSVSRAANFWMICSGVMPAGGVGSSGPKPAIAWAAAGSEQVNASSRMRVSGFRQFIRTPIVRGDGLMR